MAFDLRTQIPKIGERAEVLVTWYLRFNGFFPLPNFILHDAGVIKSPGQQLTEADILAIRLPFTKEVISAPNGTICTLRDPLLDIHDGTTDFLIGETCSEQCKFNWLGKSGKEQRLLFSYAVRRFGFWEKSEVAAVVECLIKDRLWERGNARLRLFSFGIRRDTSGTLPNGIHQIALENTLDYLRSLFSCYGQKPDRRGRNIVSDHGQWHPLIKEIYARLLGHKVQLQNPSDVSLWLFS